MSALRSLWLVVGILATANVSFGQEFRQRFVGKSPCEAELKSDQPDFSLRLDKAQKTTLLYRDFSKAKILMIVQVTGDPEHCGTIRDLVVVHRVQKDFEFRCFDPKAPTDVIVGTAIRRGTSKQVPAIDAWRIDLNNQKFVEIQDKVVCSAQGWSGEDDGSDMVNEAKKYAAHRKPGQFGPESK